MTHMRPHTQALPDSHATRTTILTREVWGDGNGGKSMEGCVVGGPAQEHAPCGITDALGKMVVLDHIRDLEVFVGNQVVRRDERVCRLAGKIFTLPLHLEIRFA